MINPNLEQELHQHLERLPPNQQQEVLDFVRNLQIKNEPIRGVSGKNFLQFAGQIDLADLDKMKQAIEESCEQVYPNEW